MIPDLKVSADILSLPLTTRLQRRGGSSGLRLHGWMQVKLRSMGRKSWILGKSVMLDDVLNPEEAYGFANVHVTTVPTCPQTGEISLEEIGHAAASPHEAWKYLAERAVESPQSKGWISPAAMSYFQRGSSREAFRRL
ncbi:hypothetical protein LTR29_017560 [Friedmanniomyces endolithicus]|nr:hypothetical protein LTR29_017560 [Friedmanniomyces endolithicus]